MYRFISLHIYFLIVELSFYFYSVKMELCLPQQEHESTVFMFYFPNIIRLFRKLNFYFVNELLEIMRFKIEKLDTNILK